MGPVNEVAPPRSGRGNRSPDVAVVGVDDRFWGEEVAAVVRPVAGEPPAEAELVELCRRHLAHFKVPRHWVFVDSFPLMPSGKVQKHILRERLACAAGTRPGASGSGAPP
ncbi:MAG TPA: hypothetical protein VKI99_15190 [Candidatus Dormibacteraeota bacterium]|nr:hypothetical protein [Candidatus Dormibacteraeota bacterium]